MNLINLNHLAQMICVYTKIYDQNMKSSLEYGFLILCLQICFFFMYKFKAKECEIPSYNNNSFLTPVLEHYYFGMDVSYNCEVGFEPIIGHTRRTCLANQTWSEQPLDCISKSALGLILLSIYFIYNYAKLCHFKF